MKISSAFPSTWLKADDIGRGKKVRVKIDSVGEESVGEGMKPVVYFKGKDKGLVLNKTNAATIVAAYGDETDDWEGQEIFLFVQQVSFQGRTVPALRVETPMVEVNEVEPEPAPVDDDEIPF